MKELVVISGKGGTGKTSVMAAFASLAKSKVLCDADVDAADLHLITAPDVQKKEAFQSGNSAIINKDKCTECGLCKELCRWNAVSDEFEIDSIACEGCGVCVYFCPEKAIDFPINTCGEWFISSTRFGPMVHARLGIAEENSGKLVTLVRKEARNIAEKNGLGLILTDGAPGIGCPVIASIGGVSAVLIVTEPSISGKHDMERVAKLADHFKVPAMVCINKCDINVEITQDIEDFAKMKSLAIVGKIPFDPIFTRSMVQRKTIFEFDGQSDTASVVRAVWSKIKDKLEI